ncbi:alpha/beta fold hydrolase [Nonlabens xiamenensis]|uniref:alpha/beta fold hydrolase n=1 Tax=Nonlabens xiamenensis TaxID=2341043 RepID=UPI000F60C856|nr:alpha/beta hydrolase [Nonlabens xiamenensis]
MKTLLTLISCLCIVLTLTAQKPIATQVTGQGDPVLLLPGFASTHVVWEETVKNFGDSHEMHTVNYAGFGELAPLKGHWLPQVLEALKDYLYEQGSKEWIIIGHSLGGTIATWLAAQPELNIREIVIVDGLPATGALIFPNFDPEQLQYDSPYNTQMMNMEEAAFGQMAAGMAQGLATDTQHQELIKKSILASDRKTYVHGYTDYLKLDLRSHLDRINLPVTILAAGQPYGTSLVQQTYTNQYASLADYDLIIREDSKHFIMFDAPDWFHDQLAAILKP